MGIRGVDAVEVSCQNCTATILVKEWPYAARHGWAVPSDGHLQLCPDCVLKQKADFKAESIQKAIIKALDAAREVFEKSTNE